MNVQLYFVRKHLQIDLLNLLHQWKCSEIWQICQIRHFTKDSNEYGNLGVEIYESLFNRHLLQLNREWHQFHDPHTNQLPPTVLHPEMGLCSSSTCRHLDFQSIHLDTEIHLDKIWKIWLHQQDHIILLISSAYICFADLCCEDLNNANRHFLWTSDLAASNLALDLLMENLVILCVLQIWSHFEPSRSRLSFKYSKRRRWIFSQNTDVIPLIVFTITYFIRSCVYNNHYLMSNFPPFN